LDAIDTLVLPIDPREAFDLLVLFFQADGAERFGRRDCKSKGNSVNRMLIAPGAVLVVAGLLWPWHQEDACVSSARRHRHRSAGV
jgi:hypothetical protein